VATKSAYVVTISYAFVVVALSIEKGFVALALRSLALLARGAAPSLSSLVKLR
jgi:hypothetical protein